MNAAGENTADGLIAGLVATPWGQVSPSIYETGRLVTLAPWLTGHTQRINYLLAAQRSDGAWGGPGGYSLVPTLSAVEALLTASRYSPDAIGPELSGAAQRGLRLLVRLLPGLGRGDLPDMPALDLIAASLVEAVNQHLNERPGWSSLRLSLPPGVNGRRLATIRSALAAGARLPEKLLHALEVAGTQARGVTSVRPGSTGTVGASPAATAAWLDEAKSRDPRNPARAFLEAVAGEHNGPVPCGIPITVFERAWVVAILARAGIPVRAPAELVASLEAALLPAGTPAGEGLPADADTTSVALYALGLLGNAHPPDSLWAYDLGTHFCTWQGEDGFSVSVNAHVLEAFGHYVAACPDAPSRYAKTAVRLSALLCELQAEDGSWSDRWHASPYYATACCTLALARFGGAGAAAAIDEAVRWVCGTQRTDGSWGRWGGTAEETAYAMQILLRDSSADSRSIWRAVARGKAFLLRADAGADEPALWHDKDLYRPTAIVRATVLAALHLARQHGEIAQFANNRQ